MSEGDYMKKLVCKYCGNAEFYVLNLEETMCKCGFKLTKLSDYKTEELEEENELLVDIEQSEQINEQSNHQLEAELISKISLLKREIDKSLDEGNKEKFIQLTSELNEQEKILNVWIENPESFCSEEYQENQK